MTRDYTKCNLALKCDIYNAENPCEKPSCKFMRKPRCYFPKKEGVISKLAERIFNVIKKATYPMTGGNLE